MTGQDVDVPLDPLQHSRSIFSASMPSSARIAKPAWIQSSTDNLLFVVARALAMSGSLRPATPPKTNADVTADLSQKTL